MPSYNEFLATPAFWKAFSNLAPAEQEAAKRALTVFKRDPFHPSLRTHKIKTLSVRWKRTIYAVDILADLRAVFFIDGDKVVSVDIGSHDIYK